MVDNASAPDVGEGPYGVLNDVEETGVYLLTLHGTPTGKSYPIGKTAYRAARKLNDQAGDAGAYQPEAGLFLEDEPKEQPAKTPKAPKAPKASKPKAPKPAVKPAEEPKAEPKAEPIALVYKTDAAFKGTREQWLNTFTDKARPIFAKRGFELPAKIRVSVGFMFRSPKAIGQCWAESASADGHREVFINPTQADSARVADILTHELCHTLFGPEEKHGKEFKRAAFGMGLEGKATATVAGDNWREWAYPILSALGPIPHGALDPSASGVKKQTTRLLKCECDTCGFIFRATAKHVNGKALRCPDFECIGDVKVDGAEEGEGE